MEAAEFEKGLLKALSELNKNDIERIREKIGVDSDYEIDEDGFTHLVIKNRNFVETKDMYKESSPEIELKYNDNRVGTTDISDYQLAS